MLMLINIMLFYKVCRMHENFNLRNGLNCKQSIVLKYTYTHVMPSCLYRPSSSAPCKPEAVQVNLECSTNKALVTWENVGPDQTQEVSAVDSRGTITTCNSSSSNCTFDQLTCGETYVINVVGHTNTCSSEPVISESLSAGKSLLLLRGPDVCH